MKEKHRDIEPGNDLWNLIMSLYRQGLSPREIGKRSDVNKDRTTIMYHLRRAGLPSFVMKPRMFDDIMDEETLERMAAERAAKEAKRAMRPVGARYKADIITYGKGRCGECGGILALLPDHSCKPGDYYDPEKRLPPTERYGNGTGN